MNHRRMRTAAIATLLATLTAFGGLAAAQGQDVPQGGTITLAWPEPVTVLDLAYGAGWPAFGASHHMTDPLIRIDAEGQPQPWLVSSWEISEDHLTYVLHLREDVRFHDGERFDAEAVRLNFQRTIDDPDTQQHTHFNNVIESVEAVDDFTVRITLKTLDADFLFTTIAHWQVRPISPADIPNRTAQTITHRFAGTGPFVFESFTPDSALVLVKNEGYWGGAPNVDRLVYRFLPELSVHTVEMMARNVDFSTSISIEDQTVLARQGVEFVRQPWPVVHMLTMNTSRGHTAELAVRRAIRHAVNREQIVATVLGGHAELSRAGVPSGTVLYNEVVPAIEYDPELAGSILDEAGWLLAADGIRYRDGQPLRLHFLNPTGAHARNAEIVQEQLRLVGFDIDFEVSEGGTYGPRWQEGEFEISMTAQGGTHWGSFLGGSVHPDDFWTNTQIRASQDPELQAVADDLRRIIGNLRATVDLDERRAIWQEGQQLFYDHALNFFLWHQPSTLAALPRVQGYEFFNQTLFLHNAYIAR